MAVYKKTFTLADIFNNKKLKGKLPLINYKETVSESGKVSYRTRGKTVRTLVFDTATATARAYYKPLTATRGGKRLELSGTLTVDHNTAVDGIYTALKGIRSLLLWTANQADMIRDALVESEKNKRQYGIDTRLYLRAGSMEEIEGMSRPQLQALLSDVMDNIVYGDNFPKTQKKWAVETVKVKSPLTYEQRQEQWKRRIGL